MTITKERRDEINSLLQNEQYHINRLVGFHKDLIIALQDLVEEVQGLEMIKNCLQELVNLQNGPPLLCDKEQFEKVMTKAKQYIITQEPKKKAIIVDLDGTLSDSRHRQHFMTGDKKDWKGFYEALSQDPINEWCKQIIGQAKKDGIHIILLSGRPSKYSIDTINWLNNYGIDFDTVILREDGDHRKDYVVKREIYEKHIAPHYDVLFCIDDRQQVVDMWRELGLVCLQCAKGNF